MENNQDGLDMMLGVVSVVVAIVSLIVCFSVL